MFVDDQNQYSDAQAVTATVVSEDVIDHGEERRLGTGHDIYLHINVDVAFTDAGNDSTVTVTLEADDNEPFSSAAVIQTIGTFAALSAVGSRLIAKLQPEILTERFTRVRYTVANGSLTTGSFTAFLTEGIAAFSDYPSGYIVS